MLLGGRARRHQPLGHQVFSRGLVDLALQRPLEMVSNRKNSTDHYGLRCGNTDGVPVGHSHMGAKVLIGI